VPVRRGARVFLGFRYTGGLRPQWGRATHAKQENNQPFSHATLGWSGQRPVQRAFFAFEKQASLPRGLGTDGIEQQIGGYRIISVKFKDGEDLRLSWATESARSCGHSQPNFPKH
jgi:hypothetical protein